MAIEFSVHTAQSKYLRTFDAEIDVPAENEILVKGRMRDHRFSFEHIWRVRTPDYEVIEAIARQVEGAPQCFDPDLCSKYAQIKGVKIGRGFSKRVVAALGDKAGAREHLLLAIEMARVGQQVYQYTPEFESQFSVIDGDNGGSKTEAARIAWLKDRAYMSDLPNSCYAYRDETVRLFESREVNCSFGEDEDIFRPKPGDRRVFWRKKSLSVKSAGTDRDGFFICENGMEDRIHDIKVGFELSNDGVISNAHSRALRVPYHGICEDAQLRTPGLNGLKVTDEFISQFADRVGGRNGCTHLFDLSIDCLRLFKFAPLVIFACLAILFSSTASAQSKASIREYKKVFKTYPYSDPNPIPVMSKIYPYYRYDLYTDKAIDKEWTVVELENDYIKVMILPEIGGKIWTAIEKSTGKPFIYFNQVIKFRDISMRGPWTSGGIEANYGIIGHTPNCATPVDYITRKNDDGSVSCFIGVLDLLTRTPWRLEVNLPPDKAYFTTSSFWYNATPLEQPYYTWMNAGIKASGNLQFIYPGTNYLGHSGEYAAWPVNKDNGRDISFYESNDFGGYKSYHVFGKYADFFGGYWHDEDFGMARYSLHEEKAGKKIWIWGLSQQGMIWEKLLTDDDGQYVEVQSGRLFNQSAEQSTFTPFKHRGFAPYASDSWTEYWFPVKNTKGFIKANPFGALNLKTGDGEMKLYFSPVQKIDDDLEVFDGDKLIYSKHLVLTPLETFSETVKTDIDRKNLRIKLGRNKLEYSAAPEADTLSRPLETPKDFDWESVFGLYLQGKEKMRQRLYASAADYLERCLKKDPNFLPALTELSVLEYRNLNYGRALDLSMKALSIDTYDPAANYYYALANLKLGKVTDAKDGFDIAAMSVEFRSAAYTELSKIYFREKQYEKSVDYARKSLDFNRRDIDALQIVAVINRLQKREGSAGKILDEITAIDPLNHFAAFEMSLRDERDENRRRAFVSMIRNEMPHETFLELAIWYHNLGLAKEAESVLKLAPQNSETFYWLAYLSGDLSLIQKADSLSTRLVFPFRSETAEVLRWVIANDRGWQPKYYLALILWSRNDEKGAWRLMKECGSAPAIDTFYAARSMLGWRMNIFDESVQDLSRAAEMDKSQWRYAKSFVDYYTAPTVERHADALRAAKEYFDRSPENYQLGLLYAKTLLLNKKYSACSELLARLNVLPYEGASDGRQIYREAQLMLAIDRMKAGDFAQALKFIAAARRWPDNLGAGKPYAEDIDERPEDWLESICYERMNGKAEATASLNRIAGYRVRRFNSGTLISALALQKLGREEDAEKIFAAWSKESNNSPLVQWSLRVFQGKPAAGLYPGDDLVLRVVDGWLGRNAKHAQ